MKFQKISGLVAATYTPMDDHGNLNLSFVLPMVDRLVNSGVDGLYVCGSTGEGMSLETQERMEVADAFVKAARGRVPVIVQVGHNSVPNAVKLSEHAAQCGADAVSATCPSYFKINSESALVDVVRPIAEAAGDRPFYYYHIPVLTGSSLSMVQFLKLAEKSISNLVGLKYTDTKVHEYQQCLSLFEGKFECLWGCDEMLLSALAVGGKGAVGSTYNLFSSIYLKMIQAFEAGNFQQARMLQLQSITMIDAIAKFPFHSAVKYLMNRIGWNVGRCRLPQVQLTAQQESQIDAIFDSLDIEQELVVS